MPHRRSTGKLETKLARNYVYENSESRHRNNNPEEITEKIFKKTEDEMRMAVLAKAKDVREGYIPEYPQGLVIGDQLRTGFFNIVTVFDETFIASRSSLSE